MARTGVDEFYETIRLLLAKKLGESSSRAANLDFETAQVLLSADKDVVNRFVEGGELLSIPPEVANECLKILAPTSMQVTSYDVLHALFEQMTGKHYKSDKGQYFTPVHVVDFCISVLRPQPGEIICDPACGSGAFLKSAFDANPKSQIYGFDISRRAAKTASLLSYLACKDKITISQIDSLVMEQATLLEEPSSSIEQFMRGKNKTFQGYDVIATNPPFAGDVSDAAFLTHYKTATLGTAKVERDTLFLERCLTLLKPNGRLAIVLPDNKISGGKFDRLRKWLVTRCKVVAVVSLHAYTFKPFTSQKACILFIQKMPKVNADYNISLYRSDKPGKTSTGALVLVNDRVDHDLDLIGADITKEWTLG